MVVTSINPCKPGEIFASITNGPVGPSNISIPQISAFSAFAVAIARKDKNVAYYALPLSIIGAFIALYHYLIQWTALRDINPISCNSVSECSQKQVVYLGFMTIPFFSFVAFLVIGALMLYLVKFPKNVWRK